MLNKPINNIVKAHFDNIYNQAKQKAEEDYILNVANKTKGLNHFDALKFHIEEKNRLKEVINSDPHPYYIKNHNSENWLLTQFASRYFLLGIEESEAFINSVYLGEYRGKISDYTQKAYKEIPKYTFKQFLEGKICKYYLEFERIYNIEREDYYNILEWQSDKLIDIVVYETNLVIGKYQEYLKTIENPLEFVNKQFTIIEEELLSSIENSEEIKTVLSKLHLFNDFNLLDYDNKLLLESYKVFHSEKIDFKKMTPLNIGGVLEKVKQNENTIISNEFTIFYTIENLSYWLKSIVEGQSYKKPFSFPVWDEVLEEAINKGKLEAEEINDELQEYAYYSEHSEEEIKKFLIKRFEEYRHIFNAFEPKELFALITDENKKALASSFRVNCFFNNDSQKYKDDLIKAIKIDIVLWDIAGIYYNVFDTKNMEISEDKSSSVGVMFLLHQMVLDKEIYNELEQSLDDFMNHFHAFSVPYPVHMENQRETFALLFHKGISRLQEVLDDAEPTNKILYLQSRIKELRQREFKFANIKELRYSEDTELKYPKLLREFLDIEADFIKETSVINDVVVIESAQPKLLTHKKTETLPELNKETRLNNVIDKMQAQVDAKNQRKIKDSLSEILDNLRGQQIGGLQLYKIVKDNTNLEKDALEYLKEDIGWYIFSMKMAQDCFYTEEQVEKAFSKIKEKGYTEEKLFELGYLKNTKTFFDEEYTDPEEPVYIDKEKLLYPSEFTSIKELLDIVKKELGKIESSTPINGKNINTFESTFNLAKQEYILKLLEDLSITKQGVYNLGVRTKGSIRGVVEALREENIIPKLSLEKLCSIIAVKINLELKSKLDWSTTSDNYREKTTQYIKDNPLH